MEVMVKRSAAFLLASALMAFFALGPPMGAGARAENLEGKLSERIEGERKELERLKDQIEKRRKALKAAATDEESAASALRDLEEKLGLLNKEQKLLKLELEQAQQKKAELEEKARDIEKKLQLGESTLAKRLRALYKAGNFSYLKAFFSSEDFADFLRQFKYARLISRLDAELLNERASQLNELRARRLQLEENQKQGEAKKKILAEKAMEINRATAEKQKLVARLKKQMKLHENQLAVLEKASSRVSSLINELLEKQKAVSEDRPSRRRASLNASQSIVGKKGKLPWPIKGKVVTQFGKVKDPRFKTYTFNKGINIKASFGSEVKAVGAGVVLFADVFRGYGKLLILDHGDGYYSLYGNTSEILVAVGEKVMLDKVVAKVGRNKDLGISALYFEIRNHGKAENPLEWLAKSG